MTGEIPSDEEPTQPTSTMSTRNTKSLHALSVENPRFAVRPLFWTSRHLNLVGCSFQQMDDTLSHLVEAPDVPDEDRTELRTELAQDLAMTSSLASSIGCVDSLLLHERSPLDNVEPSPLRFCYAKHRAHVLRLCQVYPFKDNVFIQKQWPIVGYYPYNVDEARRNRLRPPEAPLFRNNDPVQRKYDRRLRDLTPEDWRQDPYLVCILLSMGKKQWCLSDGRSSLVHLLVVNQQDTTHACVYKADIPHQLLECLECPTRSMEDFDFPTISYTKVAFKPYETLSERLLLHLVGAEYLSGTGLGAVASVPTREKRTSDGDDESGQPVQKVSKLEP